MRTINLALALHNHQPIGNFHHVFEKAVNTAYMPFLDEFERYPHMRITMHISGCLLEWAEHHAPKLLERIASLVNAGRVELMGGGMYEPIFSMLTDRDKQEQIRIMQGYVERHFGTRPRGAWVPERIWEQALVTPLATAGVEYVIVDDFHFKVAGLSEEQLAGYYLTEDQGHLLRVFASSEKLRYYIPFQDPERTIEYLASLADTDGRKLIVYGDDGEKFGLWPQTYMHVYENGWLRRFFTILDQNKDWIKLMTLGEAVDTLPPVGKIYLPDASYREMTEWALPTEAQKRFESVTEELKQTPLYDRVRPFMRGGFWRNFKIKYPESNQMYARMLEISRKLDSIKKKKGYTEARTELYRGQCNCAYWHGVFGGLYLPHLRWAIYEHLIKADTIIEQALHGKKQTVHLVQEDFDLDGAKEYRVSNPHLVAYIKPTRGGHLVEFDVRECGVNLLNTLTRRPEVYHSKLLAILAPQQGGGVRSIHDITAAKSADLDKKLHYDWYLRESLIDHFFAPEARLDDAVRGERLELGDFVEASYFTVCEEAGSDVALTLKRSGIVYTPGGPIPVEVKKAVRLRPTDRGLTIDYTLQNLGNISLDAIFGIEFNIAMLAGSDPTRYYRLADGTQAGLLQEQTQFEAQPGIDVVDDGLQLEARLSWSQPAQVWGYPIETVSQSESGFELVFQGVVVTPRWKLRLEPSNSWRVTIAHGARCGKS